MKKLLFVLFIASLALFAGEPSLCFEAEDVVVNKDAVLKDVFLSNFWRYWTRDRNKQIWSGCGIVLSTPNLVRDLSLPSDGAPPLHIRIPLPDTGPWQIVVRDPCRPIAFSRNGTDYEKLTDTCLEKAFYSEQKYYDCWFDDMFASQDGGCAYLDYFVISRPK